MKTRICKVKLRAGVRLLLLFLLLAGGSQPMAAGPEPLAKLRRDLEQGLQYKRMLAIEGLARQHDPEADGLILRAMLHDKSQPVRRVAQRKLEYKKDPRILPAIVAALDDRQRYVRLAAIDALAKVRDPAAAEFLARAAAAAPQDTALVRAVMESLRELVYWVEPPTGFETRLHPYLAHRDRRVRLTVLVVLAVLGRPASLEPLMALWPGADVKTRLRLADAFANIGRVAPASLLADSLEKAPRDLAIHSLYALAQIQSFSALPKIRALLQRHAHNRVRMACLYALLEIPDPESIPAILKAMSGSDDPTVLHWSGYALAQLQARAAIPELQRLLEHRSPLVRATAATALGELGDATGQAMLLARVRDPQEASEVRIAAAKSLMRLGLPGSPAFYWEELQKPNLDWDTRMTLSLALGASREAAYGERLAAWLDDGDFARSLSAALALGIMGDARAKTILIKALEHGYPTVRRYAILGLEGLKTDEVLAALAATANDDEDPLARILCASALTAAGLADYRVVLWNALDNREEDLRAEAAMALGRSADALTLSQLKWYLRREPSVPVRQTIQRILREHREV